MVLRAKVGLWLRMLILAIGLAGALSWKSGAGAERVTEERYDFDAFMLGDGRAIGTAQVSYGFQLWCHAGERDNRLTIAWGRNHFELRRVADPVCLSAQSLDGRLAANFDTLRGTGEGSLNGVDGARATWTFVDGGGIRAAYAEVSIIDPTGRVLLRASGPSAGRHRATGQALLPATPGIDPDNVVHSLSIDELGRPTLYTRTPLSEDAPSEWTPEIERKPDAVADVPEPRLHQDLEQMLAGKDLDRQVTVVVNLRDDLAVPRFPDLPRGVDPRSREAALIAAEQAALVQKLAGERARSTEALLQRAVESNIFSVKVIEQLWLTNSFVASMRLGDVEALASFAEVVHIEPNTVAVPVTPPHHDGAPDYPPHGDMWDVRRTIGSDAYFNLGLRGGTIGLIDTGFNPHTLFEPPDNHILGFDCFDGGPYCNNFNLPNYDLFDCHDHGTSAAAIITGNDHLGDANRGVTAMRVHSWKVWFRGPPHCGDDSPTNQVIGRAFQSGLFLGNRVFAANIQMPAAGVGSVARAADQAFDAGAVIVAANGNCAVSEDCKQRMGPPAPQFETVRSPAIAHKVLGVGDFNVIDLATRDYQGRGPAGDGRIKPDIQAPTDFKTASTDSVSALKERFGGTSAATPVAAGAAALLKEWLKTYNTFDPGFTYARMILSGDQIWRRGGYSNVFGAGHLTLPTLCGLTANWGKVTVYRTGRGQSYDITLPIASGRSLAVALWWPESERARGDRENGVSHAHNDIDLFVLDPNGVQQASARSQPSIFERTEVAGPLVAGTWTVRIAHAAMGGSSQTVYWTADVRRHCFGQAPSDRGTLAR